MAAPTPIPAKPVPGTRRTSRLAIVALVLSLVVCLPPLTLAGIVLGVLALVRLGRHPELEGRGISIAAILAGSASTILGTFLVFLFGLPFFIGYEGHALRSDARNELRSVASAEAVYHLQHGHYAKDLAALAGAQVSGRYAVELVPGKCEVSLERAGGGPPLSVGVSGGPGTKDEAYVAVARAKLAVVGLDCWSISSVDRIAPNGKKVLAGFPYHDQNDLHVP